MGIAYNAKVTAVTKQQWRYYTNSNHEDDRDDRDKVWGDRFNNFYFEVPDTCTRYTCTSISCAHVFHKGGSLETDAAALPET